MDLKESDILGADIDIHWYYRSKASAMAKFLSKICPTIILDVGAGSAFFTEFLLKNSSASEAWCIDTSYVDEFDCLLSGKVVHYRRSIDSVNANLVLLMDVLEHVDDEIGLMHEYIQKVPSGTVFLITVPAFNFLWSQHDVFLGHKRRYTLKQIEDVLIISGLVVERSSYFFSAIFPIAACLRCLSNVLRKDSQTPRSQLKRHHPIVNKILYFLSRIELYFFGKNHMFGLTVFCLAKKP